MLRTKNFGRKSLNEIKEILGGLGLSFGMKYDAQGRLVLPGGILPTNAPIPVEESDLDAESDAEELDEVEETGDEVTE